MMELKVNKRKESRSKQHAGIQGICENFGTVTNALHKDENTLHTFPSDS